MDKESLFTKLVNNTMVSLKKINSVVKVFIFGKMEGNIKENGKKGK